ncbi:hypothetical protein [Halobacillus sp. BAB-2008]|uniref:hypothetical protein n=1 Tax=Halobacillus sp. BAB-2008 TaxID=1246484 RepID=UPI0002DB0C71|nr:hypothetical protein [Halobacillus sp. BAB-2008]
MKKYIWSAVMFLSLVLLAACGGGSEGASGEGGDGAESIVFGTGVHRVPIIRSEVL